MKPLKALKAALEKRCISRALNKHDGCIRRAAMELKVDSKIVYRVVRKHGLQHLVRRHKGAPPQRAGNAAWQALADA